MAGLELRRIRAAEHEAAGDVCVAAYEPFLTGAEDDYRARLHDVATRDAQAEVWVALGEDRVSGVVTYCPPGSPWREIARADEGEFRMLAVDPAVQGAGAGTALARLCEDRAREDGAAGMALSSLATMTTAHRVYTRLGYDRDPGRDWSPLPGVELLAFSKVF
jgi:GNAT superfamily N-acetyltransferase